MKDVKTIEKAEEATLRDIMKTQCSAPKHLLYLELGMVPARFVIKQRKIMYLKHILVQNEHSLLKKVFDTQVKFPSKGDWVSDINNTLKEIDINKTFEELKNMPKKNLSSIINLAVKKQAFLYFIAIQKHQHQYLFS